MRRDQGTEAARSSTSAYKTGISHKQGKELEEKMGYDAHEEGRPEVFGTGLVALDVVITGSDHQRPLFRAGGTCGNVLTILSHLGWKACPVARLNGDPA